MRTPRSVKPLLLFGVLALLLGLLPSAGFAQGQDTAPVLIGFRDRPGPAQEVLVRSHGGTVKYTYRLTPAIAASVPAAAIDSLRRNPQVTTVEPDIQAHIVDAELDNTWGVKRIGAGPVHDGGNQGAGVRVGILDTGIAAGHPDLHYEPSCSKSFVPGESLEDGAGHGSHVAGTIAALKNGAGVVGVAPGATLCVYKVLNNQGSGSFSDIIAAVEQAVADGVRVTNNSYGSTSDPGTIVHAAFDNAYTAGVLHISAAGNSGNPAGKGENCGFPARWSSVVAVAATTADDTRASFSSTCAELELAAPGVSILSTVPGGGYGTMSGTSMASPHVAGAAALVYAANAGWSNGEVRTRLQSTALDLGVSGRDAKFGYGLVDVLAAAAPGSGNGGPTVIITSPSDGTSFASGTTIAFSGSASDAEDGDLTAALTWTSNIDGPVGTGGSFSRTLSDGTHIVTASVTDTGGAVGSASVTVTVGTPPPPPALSVAITSDKASYVHGQQALLTVTVTSGGAAVAGASVQLQITTAAGGALSSSATTNSQGIAQFRYKVNSKRDGVGTYAATATATKTGYSDGSGSTTFDVTG